MRSARCLFRHATGIAVLAAVGLTAACGGGEAGGSGDSAGTEETFTLTVQTVSPVDNPTSVDFQRYLDELEAASDGRLQFEVHPSAELVPTEEALDATGQGTIDMLIAQPTAYTSVVPEGGWVSLPVYPEGFEDTLSTFYDTELHSVLDEAYQEKANVKVIGARPISPYVFIMAEGKAIESVEDFTGKKLRVSGGPTIAIVEELGATPVTLAPGDMYTALQQGVVDGLVLPLYTLESYQLADLAGSATLPGIGVMAAQMVWMNLDTWNELPPDLQQLINETATQDLPATVDFWNQEEQSALDYAMENGVEIIEFSEAEQQQMEELTAEAVADMFVNEAGENGETILKILRDGA